MKEELITIPSYAVFEFTVLDQDAYMTYREIARASMVEFGATIVVAPAPPVLVEGWSEDTRVIVLRFDDPSGAKRWYESEAYAAARAIAPQAMDRRMALVESPVVTAS